jgi:thioesterase domain-containing protein
MNSAGIDSSPDVWARVRALSPERQRLLAQWVGQAPTAMEAGGRRQLVAYVRPGPDGVAELNSAASEWRDFLRERLPEYMIPQRFTLLEEFPRLPNGKVDRNALMHLPPPALPARAQQEPEGQEKELLGIMREIWKDVLQADEVFPEDNFFELGGDSLLSINVVSRAKREGVLLNPSELFDFPILSELCSHLTEESESRQADAHGSLDSPLRSKNAQGSERPFFMVHGGGRLLSKLKDSLGPEQPIHLLSAHWESGSLVNNISLEELATEALVMLRQIQPEGPYAMGGYSFGAVIACEIAQQLARLGEHIDVLFMLDPPENPDIFHSVASDAAIPATRSQEAGFAGDHAEQLRRLSPGEAASYLLSKLSANVRHYASRLSLDAKYRYARTCRKLGYPVPASIRKLYTFRIYLAASKRYELQPLNCPIVIYRATRGYHKYGLALWQAMAQGGLTLEEFDCEHDDLQWDPDVVAQWTSRFSEEFQLHADKGRTRC